MQNRRLAHDDWRGVGEALDETNSDGVGIEVNTRYFLQLFDYTNEASLQRKVQLVVDEPINYFVAEASSNAAMASPLTRSQRQALPEFDGDLKVHLMPDGHNRILIRLENMSDLFDGTPAETPMFNLKSYAEDLFTFGNGDIVFDMKITERSLSNNQDYSEMAAKKFAWPTESGPSPVQYPADQEPDSIVALQP